MAPPDQTPEPDFDYDAPLDWNAEYELLVAREEATNNEAVVDNASIDWILRQELLAEEADLETNDLVRGRRPWGVLNRRRVLHGDFTLVISAVVTTSGILVKIRAFEGIDGYRTIGTEHDRPGCIMLLRATFIWNTTLEYRDCAFDGWVQILRVAQDVLRSYINDNGEYVGAAEGERRLMLLGYEAGSVIIVP